MFSHKTLRCTGLILMLIGAVAPTTATTEAAAEPRARPQTTAQAGNLATGDEGDQTDLLSQPVTLDLANASLRSALEAIARRAGITLAYNADILPVGRTVTVHASALPAGDALARVLEGTGLALSMTRSGYVMLARRTDDRAAITDGVGSVPQQATVTGTVTDAGTGKALRGAHVRVHESELSAVTDADGRYTLEDVPSGTHTLVATIIGYGVGRREVTVTAGTTASVDFALTVSAVPLDEMVVTGTMVPTRMRGVPSPVSVVTAEDIERKGIVRFEDILRSIPGVGVVSNAGQESLSILYVRGANAFVQSTVKTYIDGVEVANPVYSLNQIDPASIERIEMVRGPQASTLHGSEAIAGVLQIFTKKGHVGPQRPQIQATLAGGGLESRYSSGLTPIQRHSIELTGSEQRLSYRLGASYSYTGEWVDDDLLDELGWDVRNSAIEDMGLSGGLRYTTGRLTAEASARIHRKTSGAPLNEALVEPARTARWDFPHMTKPSGLENEFDLQTYGLNLQYAATANWQHRLTIGQDGTRAEFRQPQPRLVTPADTFLLYQSIDWVKRSVAYGTALQADLGAHVSSTLQAGFDRSTFSQQTVITQDAKQLTGGLGNQTANLTLGEVTNHGFFAQVQTAWREQLFLTAGLRADQSTGFGDDHGYAWSPRVGLTHVLDLGEVTFKSRAAYGSAIRPPKPEQKLGQTLANFVTLPNERLAPERQSGYDLGLELYVGRRFSVGVTHFDQRAEDLVDNVRISEIGAVPQVEQFQNVGRIENTGWELEGEVSVGRVTASGSYSLIESTVERLSPTYTGTDLVVGQPPLGTPRRTGALNVTYANSRASITLGMSYKGSWDELRFVPYYDALLGTDPNREPFTGNVRDYVARYPSIQRYELNATYRFTPRIGALLMIDNVLDDETPDALDIDLVRGREMVVGIRWAADL